MLEYTPQSTNARMVLKKIPSHVLTIYGVKSKIIGGKEYMTFTSNFK